MAAKKTTKKNAESENLLAPANLFLSSGVHIGLKYKTKMMEDYIYKIRPDGLNVLNVQMISDRIKLVAKFISKYEPKDILVVSRRDVDKILTRFSEITGIKVMPGRYLPGTMTNPEYDNYYEPKILVVTDPWQDRNALKDALKIGIPIVGLCGTSNTTNNLDLIVPCNNKSAKSIGFVYWLLAREFLRVKGLLAKDKELSISLEDFTSEKKEEMK